MLPCYWYGVSLSLSITNLRRRNWLATSGGVSLPSHFLSVFFYWFRFVWDEAKYPTMSPLKEIVDGIHSQVAKIEDDLKVYSITCSFLLDLGDGLL